MIKKKTRRVDTKIIVRWKSMKPKFLIVVVSMNEKHWIISVVFIIMLLCQYTGGIILRI